MAGWTEHIGKQRKMRPYEYFAKDHLGNVRVVFSPNGRSAMRVQEDHYYPFGMPMPYTHYASSTSTPNRLLYNSKELLNYLPGLRWYDYGARMYDAQVGRFYSVDFKAEKFYSISPYAYCNNNPIRFIDPTGMEFTDDAWKQVKRLIADIDARQARNNKTIAEKKARLEGGGLSAREEKKLIRQIEQLESTNAALEQTRGEIAMLAASDQKYDIKIDYSMNINGAVYGTGENRSGVVFNFKNGNFEILLGDGSLASLAHELKHAYQFETGSLSSGYRKDGAPFYDKMDEWEAYSRGTLFGGERIYTLPSLYDKLQDGPMDASKLAPIILSNPAALQRIANATRSAFRVNGVTYKMQGEE